MTVTESRSHAAPPGSREPGEARTANPAPPFDSDLQDARFCDMREFLPELLDIFRKNAPAYAQTLRAALEAGDLKGASQAAHAMKGMCSVVCARPLERAAAALEDAARGGDAGECARLLDAVEARLAEALECLGLENP